jgi:hypothetical protein
VTTAAKIVALIAPKWKAFGSGRLDVQLMSMTVEEMMGWFIG